MLYRTKHFMAAIAPKKAKGWTALELPAPSPCTVIGVPACTVSES
jgi:hypothetical protein